MCVYLSVCVQVMQFIEKKQQSHRSVSHLQLVSLSSEPISCSHLKHTRFHSFWPVVVKVNAGSLNLSSFLSLDL